MSHKKPTIWMNLTTSMHWKRPSVGIVRVEKKLCFELKKIYGNRFRQCVWQKNKFITWDAEILPEQMRCATNRDSPPLSVKKPDLPPIFALLSKRQALVAFVQVLWSLTPAFVRPYFNRFLYFIRPAISKLLAKTYQAHQNGDINHQVLFAPNDILLSVGTDWSSPLYQAFSSIRKRQKVKVITCCYDLIPVFYQQYCAGRVAEKFSSYFLTLADSSDLMLCISKRTEHDLLQFLKQKGSSIPKTQVFPLGDQVYLGPLRGFSSQITEICSQPFILYVSSIDARKNHEVLYRAYHLLCSEGKREQLPRLVFVGTQTSSVNDLMRDMAFDILTKDLICQLDHVSDDELSTLYQSALFCVYPSLYEGWGLPIGEALAMGKAVIASDRGSITEVGGDFVHYIDPWDTKAWAEGLYKMSTDTVWRNQWEAKVKSGYKIRTWQDSAKTVAEAIESLYENEQVMHSA